MQRNRFSNLVLYYGRVINGKILPDQEANVRVPLTLRQMIRHVDYFLEPFTPRKREKKRRGGDGGGQGGGGGERDEGGGGGGADGGGDGDDGDDAPGSGSNKKRACGPNRSDQISSGGVVAMSLGTNVKGIAAEPSKQSPPDSEGEESTSSYDSESDYTFDSTDEEDYADYSLKSHKTKDGKVKYTMDCNKLEFVDENGKALKISVLSLESKGIVVQEVILKGKAATDLGSKGHDTVMASIEGCSVEVTFCNGDWEDQTEFIPADKICVKLKFTNSTNSVAVAAGPKRQFGRGPINVEIIGYEAYSSRSIGGGTLIPIAPGSLYTLRRVLSRPSSERDRYPRFVTPNEPGKYKVKVINTSFLTGRKFTFDGEFSFSIVKAQP